MNETQLIIKALRDAGYSDETVVDDLGTVVLKTYWNWFNGTTKPSLANLKLLRLFAAGKGVKV